LNRTLETAVRLWHRTPRRLRLPILVVAAALLAWWIIPTGGPDLPTVKVMTGEFVVDLEETGRLRAENSVTITAPPVRMNLQIVYLAPEGTVVKGGDLLIQFDTTEIKQVIDDRLAELDIARANLTRSLAAMASHMAALESSVENSRASYRLAELRLDQMKFEADVRVEEGKLNLKQAEISLHRAEQQVEAQRLIDSADVRSLELKIRQAELDLDKTNRDLAKLTVHAPAPGLVVHKETWKGSEMSKVKVGDTPWRGMALIELPDLSVMMVETSISEVNVSKVAVEQEVEIKLDAYPEPTFHGKVVEVAVLASEDEGASDAKVFDVVVRIDESDPVLRPGMSATARIIVDRQPDRMWVPVEAVFDRGERMVVCETAGSGFKEREVILGARNDNYVVIESGLDPDATVSLVDPTLADQRQVRQLEPRKIAGEETVNTATAKQSSTPSPQRPRPRRDNAHRR